MTYYVVFHPADSYDAHVFGDLADALLYRSERPNHTEWYVGRVSEPVYPVTPAD